MSNNKGFTLIEMLITVAIVSIIAGIAIANYYAQRQNRQLNRASREVYSAMQTAKLAAIRDNSSIFVTFTPGTAQSGTYRVFEDLDSDGLYDAGVERSFASGEMPPTITLQNPTFNFTHNAVVFNNLTRFTSLGLTTGANGSVPITNGQRTANIVVGLAGDVRVDS